MRSSVQTNNTHTDQLYCDVPYQDRAWESVCTMNCEFGRYARPGFSPIQRACIVTLQPPLPPTVHSPCSPMYMAAWECGVCVCQSRPQTQCCVNNAKWFSWSPKSLFVWQHTEDNQALLPRPKWPACPPSVCVCVCLFKQTPPQLLNPLTAGRNHLLVPRSYRHFSLLEGDYYSRKIFTPKKMASACRSWPDWIARCSATGNKGWARKRGRRKTEWEEKRRCQVTRDSGSWRLFRATPNPFFLCLIIDVNKNTICLH